MKAVIKIGGSFQASDKLENLCSTVNTILKDHRLVIVPGGGQFADQVRKLQKEHDLSDKSSHFMAIKGMETYGLALRDLITDIGLTDDFREAKKGSVIFLPYRTVKKFPDLQPTWKITSDSISAWICGKIGFKNLILVKRNDIITGLKRTDQISTQKLSEMNQTIVDPKLPELLEEYNITCWLVNGEFPGRLKNLLEGKSTEYTKIYPRK